MDDGFMDEQNILDDLPMEMLEQHACPSDFSPNLLTQVSSAFHLFPSLPSRS